LREIGTVRSTAMQHQMIILACRQFEIEAAGFVQDNMVTENGLSALLGVVDALPKVRDVNTRWYAYNFVDCHVTQDPDAMARLTPAQAKEIVLALMEQLPKLGVLDRKMNGSITRHGMNLAETLQEWSEFASIWNNLLEELPALSNDWQEALLNDDELGFAAQIQPRGTARIGNVISSEHATAGQIEQATATYRDLLGHANKVCRQLAELDPQGQYGFTSTREESLQTVLLILTLSDHRLVQPAPARQVLDNTAPERTQLWHMLFEQVSLSEARAPLTEQERFSLVRGIQREIAHFPDRAPQVRANFYLLLSSFRISDSVRVRLDRVLRSTPH
jgi:hypothetical protein